MEINYKSIIKNLKTKLGISPFIYLFINFVEEQVITIIEN